MRLEIGSSIYNYQRFHIVHGFFQIIDTQPIDSLSTDESTPLFSTLCRTQRVDCSVPLDTEARDASSNSCHSLTVQSAHHTLSKSRTNSQL